jgi:hypothetical protein
LVPSRGTPAAVGARLVRVALVFAPASGDATSGDCGAMAAFFAFFCSSLSFAS